MALFPTWLLIVAATVVVILSVLAGYFLHKLSVAQKQQAEQLSALAQAAAGQRQRANESIQIIARALLDKGIGLTEASIRIRGLLDALQVDQAVRDEFVAFYTLAEKTAHIPILQEWKQLSRKQQFQFELEMARLEAEYGDFALDAAERMIGRSF
ncbi:DUF2489 domain-containing protein [Microbulbifer spongiae]|uniref:DUF2489 domain-containing protein n=1 Tax=Microbulbifer spongiae TaxID=2944933 RepID=A0ABY9EH24_9GAMM|nr:DUF2489 domain-containing protein [Microbulbifer sp. MI-G]WKD51438.1 DUF2489 domain-containing protein [Microbulbifer sp. MI-G]